MEKGLDVICFQRKYCGVGLVKSRKASGRVLDMCDEMIAASKKRSIKLLEIVIDKSSGTDIDRKQIDRIVELMEKDCVDVIVVRSIWDISKDEDDLKAFLKTAQELNVSVYSMEHGMNITYEPENEETQENTSNWNRVGSAR